jgi:hypothetical protein
VKLGFSPKEKKVILRVFVNRVLRRISGPKKEEEKTDQRERDRGGGEI